MNTYPDNDKNADSIYFISDKLKSAISVSTLNEITHLEGEYNCIRVNPGDRLFMKGEEEIV